MLFKILRTLAMLTAIVSGLAVAFGLAWLGSNLFDEKLTPAARALLAPHHDPFAPGDNIFAALVAFDAPSRQPLIQANAGTRQADHLTLEGSTKSWPWATPSIWQSAKRHRTQIAALVAANQDLYRRYLGMHASRGYFDSAPPGSYAPDFLLPHEVQALFLADAADKLQTGTPAQQAAALAELRQDIRMWKAVLDGHGGLVSKMMAAISLHADFLLLGDMVADPDFHPALLGDGMESVVAPFPEQDWKIGSAYGWEMRNSAPLLEAIVSAKTRVDGSNAPHVQWWKTADTRLSARFFKLNATENLEADRMQQLCALTEGDPGSFIERRDRYREWESHEFPLRISWYNPIGRALLTIGTGAHYENYPARVFDIAAFQRLVFLAYQIRRRGIGFKGIPEFMKQHPEWSTHPVDAMPFYWNAAKGTLGVKPIGDEMPQARFSLKLVEIPQNRSL